MVQLQNLLAVLVTLVAGADCFDTTILKPVRADGDEVGLILLPNIYLSGEDYISTARAIQAASQLRIWVVTTTLFRKGSDVFSVHGGIKESMAKLKNAGMKSKNFVGVGHGRSGRLLQSYAMNYKKLSAIILFGATLPRSMKLQDYHVPILTLAAELDGITRITRVAEEYGKLKEDLKTSLLALYKTPVILIEGANHAQFYSGNLSSKYMRKDLTLDVTLSPGLLTPHVQIAKHVNSFLVSTFSTSTANKKIARAELKAAFIESGRKLQPFLDIKELDKKDDFSKWTALAQKRFAGKFADQIKINNTILNLFWFFSSTPSINIENGRVTVETSTLVRYEDKEDYARTPFESPIEINMKLKSKEAIWKAVVNSRTHQDDPKVSLIGEPETCKSLNEYALDIALKYSSPTARDRYRARGRQIIFEDDNVVKFAFLWPPTPLKTWEDADGLHVEAIARVTPASGLHYCKVITPYRAMEWIHVDSLRKF